MKKRKKVNREGFSLVEMIIAITISAIVMAAIIALLAYASNSMKVTQARVELQEQAKDATNHISTYAMESADVKWNDTTMCLTVIKEKIGSDGNVESTEEFYYWKKGTSIYFAQKGEVDPAALPEDKKFLLAEDIESFECGVSKNADNERKTLHVMMKLKDDVSEFACSKDIYLRNQ